MKKHISYITALLIMASTLHAAEESYWKQRIETAQPGETVLLPAGTYDLADVQVPSGVTLQGVDYLRTVLDASGGMHGLILEGQDSSIRNLTLRNAPANGILIQNADGVNISGVRLQSGLIGMVLRDSQNVRVENCIVVDNRMGVSFSKMKASSFVNGTLHNNGNLGFSITDSENLSIFNNLITDSVIGLYVEGLKNCAIDYNRYKVTYFGKTAGQVRTITPQRFAALTGTSRHSTLGMLDYANTDEGIYTPATPLRWALHKPATSFLGIKELGGVKAPSEDIFGVSRASDLQLGAVQSQGDPTLTPVGQFKIRRDEGVKSAGLYTPEGVLVSFMFNNLPLKKGSYPFTFPTTDWQGKPIPPGDYELRVVESNLEVEYKGLVFNNGITSARKDHSPYSSGFVTFAPDGRILMGNHWSESKLQVRTFDPDYQKAGWVATGDSNLRGMSFDGDHSLYLLKHSTVNDAFAVSLYRYHMDSGELLPFTPEEPTPTISGIFSDQTRGLAVLNGTLYISDPGSGKIFVSSSDQLDFTKTIELEKPGSIAADVEAGTLWVISGDKQVICLDTNGTVLASHDYDHAIRHLSAAPGKLAMLSEETGKVYVYDTDPKGQLRLSRTLGTGEDPVGPYDDFTFTFKRAPGSGSGRSNVGIHQDGSVFVIDMPRTLYYDPEGRLIRKTISVWGQHLVKGKLVGDEQDRWWNISGNSSIKIDSKKDEWKPDGIWSFDPAWQNFERTPVGFFHLDDRNFLLIRGNIDYYDDGSFHPASQRTNPEVMKHRKIYTDSQFILVEFDANNQGKTIATWQREKIRGAAWSVRKDTNQDGLINNEDAPPVVIKDENGEVVEFGHAWYFRQYLDDQQNLLLMGPDPTEPSEIGRIVALKGLDAEGIPEFDWAHPREIYCRMPGENPGTFTSPYDFTTEEKISSRVAEFRSFSDGTIAFDAETTSGAGKGFTHVAATDIAAADADGNFRWIHPAPRAQGLHGIQIVQDILISQDYNDLDWYMLNKDGLGLGIGGIDPEMLWQGMWNDHPKQFRAYEGNDGNIYLLLGDYVMTAFHHFALKNKESIQSHTVKVTRPAEAAAPVVMRPGIPFPAHVGAPTFKVKINRLKEDLPIDGDLEKWRKLGIAPQIIVTPETAVGDIEGPQDISALVRLAHKDGALYVQAIKFDDVVTMHQTLEKHYLQDSFELCLNGFLSGFKFNVMKTKEHGITVFRDQFGHTDLHRVLPEDEFPRVIRVLDSAESVEERTYIENIYGIDLKEAKVIVTEFKLPMEKAFEGKEAAGVAGNSGDQIWLGIMVDDNDKPGTDIQDLLVWPATYSTFSQKENSALATFE